MSALFEVVPEFVFGACEDRLARFARSGGGALAAAFLGAGEPEEGEDEEPEEGEQGADREPDDPLERLLAPFVGDPGADGSRCKCSEEVEWVHSSTPSWSV